MRANKAVNERFEGGLDICKLVETSTNVNLLLQTLLSKPAQFLFFNHRDRVVRSTKIGKKKTSDAKPEPSTESEVESSDDVRSLKSLWAHFDKWQPSNPTEIKLLLSLLPMLDGANI